MKNIFPLAIALFLFICSCSDSTSSGEAELSGVYVLNEGNFGGSNSSITSYNPDTRQVSQGVYQSVNNRPVGDVLQSVSQIGDKLFLVVNNSHTIEVVESTTFTSIASIEIADQASPRYFEPVTAEKAYVTNLFGNSVSIIDLENYEETSTIAVGNNPDGLARVGNRVYVANSGLGNGNTLSVIDTDTDQVTETINVGDNPVTVVRDDMDRIWVVCVGAYGDFSDPDDDTPGQIYVLEGSSGDVLSVIDIGGHPGEFVIDAMEGKAFLISDGVMEINTTTYEITNRSFINRSFYALGLSTLGGETFLWATDALNFTQSGKAYQFNLNGVAIDSFETGIIPGAFYFSEEQALKK